MVISIFIQTIINDHEKLWSHHGQTIDDSFAIIDSD